MNKLNSSIKHHLLVGLFISLWGFIFAFLVRPFNDGTLNFKAWILISIGFNFISFISYALLSVIQKRVYQKILTWNLLLEIASILLFCLLYIIGTYTYYKSPLLGGGYSFFNFIAIISFKTLLVLTPIIILARRYLIKLIPIEADILTIKGENKLDILKIKKSDLICISKAQNYVEIFFIQDDQLRSKIIRSSLKKIQENLDFLIQTHRSHLINPSHFRSWKNHNTITLTKIDLPVSKIYKHQLLSL